MYLLDTNALLILLHDEVAEAALTDESKDIIISEERLYLSVVS